MIKGKKSIGKKPAGAHVVSSLFEVKPDFSSASLYSGIGQLFFN
jgi:hypothetical protein